MILRECGLDSWKVCCEEFRCWFFYKIIADQMDGELGTLFPLRVVHLMCARCVTVRGVCFKENRRLKTGGEADSKVKYLLRESAVEMANARPIV